MVVFGQILKGWVFINGFSGTFESSGRVQQCHLHHPPAITISTGGINHSKWVVKMVLFYLHPIDAAIFGALVEARRHTLAMTAVVAIERWRPWDNFWTIDHWIGLREIYRKPWFLPSNIGFSCKFSHHPILWTEVWGTKPLDWWIYLICIDLLSNYWLIPCIGQWLRWKQTYKFITIHQYHSISMLGDCWWLWSGEWTPFFRIFIFFMMWHDVPSGKLT